ncbi:hypothetical protein [Microbacterium sp.]|uniref:hypothetical protein n=1 Tax=Microbacterium sp. TaxID=51671 RepID=UPI003734D59A
MAARIPNALRSVADSRSVPNLVVTAAATAALTLVDPATLRPGARFAYRAANAALAGFTTWTSLRRADWPLGALPMRAGVTAGAVGATFGVAEVGEALDARLQSALLRGGVTRPRVLLAAAGVGLLALGWWGDRHLAASDDTTAEAEEFTEPESVEVPEPVRGLVSALLGRTEHFGAPELRAQLDAARANLFEGPDGPDGFAAGIGFEVPEDLPLAVPADANFPVVARYRPLDGRTFEVYLTVMAGRLSSLAISEGRDWTDAEQQEWFEAGRGAHELAGWPSLDEIEWCIETSTGLRPLD